MADVHTLSGLARDDCPFACIDPHDLISYRESLKARRSGALVNGQRNEEGTHHYGCADAAADSFRNIGEIRLFSRSCLANVIPGGHGAWLLSSVSRTAVADGFGQLRTWRAIARQ
jgi:hypothetical protein